MCNDLLSFKIVLLQNVGKVECKNVFVGKNDVELSVFVLILLNEFVKSSLKSNLLIRSLLKPVKIKNICR